MHLTFGIDRDFMPPTNIQFCYLTNLTGLLWSDSCSPGGGTAPARQSTSGAQHTAPVYGDSKPSGGDLLDEG